MAIEQEMYNGHDQLLELNSCRKEQAEKLVNQLDMEDQDLSLWFYIGSLFDCYSQREHIHDMIKVDEGYLCGKVDSLMTKNASKFNSGY